MKLTADQVLVFRLDCGLISGYLVENRRAFLKRPENFSGPKTFRGSFRVNFPGPGKRFSTRPKTPRILTRVFWVVFSGLQRELDSDLLRT